MKHGYLKGHKVAECQDGQAQLMARFLREGVVDEWRDSGKDAEPAGQEAPPAPGPAQDAEPEVPPTPDDGAAQEAPAQEPPAQEAPEPGGAGGGTSGAETTEAKANGKAKPGKRGG
jgi:hypothetical protein